MGGYKINFLDDIFKNIVDDFNEGVYFVDQNQKITYWNKGAENLTGYSKEDVLGKCCRDNILCHINSNGKRLCETNNCPISKVLMTGISVEEEFYYHHKDGHRIPVKSQIRPIYNSTGNIVGATEIFSNKNGDNYPIQRIKKLQELALLDPLTKVGNRRFGEINLQSKLNELKRYNWSFGVLFIDVDLFKNVNDLHGHDVGDRVLKMVTQTLVNSLRSFDIVCRWGGEEFLTLIININEDELWSISNKLLWLVEKSSLSLNSSILNVTVSIGATLAKSEDTEESILRRADQLLYSSKSAGRNRVSMD